MKKTLSLIIHFALLLSLAFGQKSTYHSWDGQGLRPNSKLRVLNIFVNVIYDEHPDINVVESDFWPRVTKSSLEGVNVPGTIPTYLLDFMDTAYHRGHLRGCITRLYGEASFDSLQLTGDFIVVNVREKRVLDSYPSFRYDNVAKAAVDVINEKGFQTIYGHNSIQDYDYEGKGQFYYTQVLIRNVSKDYGGLGMSSGFGGNQLTGKHITINNVDYRFTSKGTLQNVGGNDITADPTDIVPHEISHSLFGSNNFHTSGGNHRGTGCTMPFMTVQGGHGLMGAAGSGLVCCNAYERWRMHWKHADASDYISARNMQNDASVNSDICKEDGEKWFVLRDFVTYGDAVRIKLPYKDSTITPNQYIWLEFHNVGHNGKLDFFQHSNTSCLHPGTPGIYAYYQIGRDVLESDRLTEVWDNVNRDNLRVISNEGYWDYTRHVMPRDTNFVCTQWNWVEDYFVPEFPNAFGGYQDQEKFIVPKDYDTDLGNTVDSVFVNGHFSKFKNVIREYVMMNKMVGGAPVRNSISFMGDQRDAFSTHRKINMGTNPSTCNTKTYYTNNNNNQTKLLFNANAQYNNTVTYLSGLGIDMMPMSDGASWLVKIRWDDYDITDDARWTGRIVLKGDEQVNLTRGHTITFAQNRTPAQQYRDALSGYFAEPTHLTCEAGSVFTQQPHSKVILTEKSRLELDSAAAYRLGEDARIVVQDGSTLDIRCAANFDGESGSSIIVKRRSTLRVDDVEELRGKVRVVVRGGAKIIGNSASPNSSLTK